MNRSWLITESGARVQLELIPGGDGEWSGRIEIRGIGYHTESQGGENNAFGQALKHACWMLWPDRIVEILRDGEPTRQELMARVAEQHNPIGDDVDNAAALAVVERLWRAEPGTTDGDRLRAMIVFIDAYEKLHRAVAPPTSEQAAAFREEQSWRAEAERRGAELEVLKGRIAAARRFMLAGDACRDAVVEALTTTTVTEEPTEP